MSYQDDYWKQREADAIAAVNAAFARMSPRSHFDIGRMVGESMRECKGKNNPTVVHEVVVRKIVEKKAELKTVVADEFNRMVMGPYGLQIGSKQDIEKTLRILIERVYEMANRDVDYNVLQQLADEVIIEALKANQIPDYRVKNRTCSC